MICTGRLAPMNSSFKVHMEQKAERRSPPWISMFPAPAVQQGGTVSSQCRRRGDTHDGITQVPEPLWKHRVLCQALMLGSSGDMQDAWH